MQDLTKLTPSPAARTIEATCQHYGWTRTFVFAGLASGDLIAVKAGRRTLVTTDSADKRFGSLPRAVYRAPRSTSDLVQARRSSDQIAA